MMYYHTKFGDPASKWSKPIVPSSFTGRGLIMTVRQHTLVKWDMVAMFFLNHCALIGQIP